jgi:hypothetical protein
MNAQNPSTDAPASSLISSALPFFSAAAGDLSNTQVREFKCSSSIEVPASSDAGSCFVQVFDFLAEDSVQDLLARVSAASLLSVKVRVSSVYSDLDLRFRLVPALASFVGNIARKPSRAFAAPYSASVEFSSKVLGSSRAEVAIDWPPELINRCVHGVTNLAPLPRLMISVMRNPRGEATTSWAKVRIFFDVVMEMEVAGHGVWM